MTISLPPSRVKKLLKNYFSGCSQQEIAHQLAISQGTISHWAERFNKRAIDKGLLNAAKEFGVLDEIVELRSLSVELDKAGITTHEAKTGVKIMKKFKKLGVEPEQHEALVEVCAQVKDPDFIGDALKLHRIKMESGLDYSAAIVKYEKTVQGLPQVNEKLEKAKAELEYTTGQVEEKKKQLDSLQSNLDHLKKAAEEKMKAIKKEVADKEKEVEVTKKEINEVAALKTELSKQGLDIPTLIKLAKELTNGK